MKLSTACLLGLLVPAVLALRPSTRSESQTLVVATLDSSRADAFIGNLRFAGTELVYAGGVTSAAAARRVSTALGARVLIDSTVATTPGEAAAAIADRVRNVDERVVVVLVDSALALPFLRHVTGQPRASFPLSAAPGRMWVVTRGDGYDSAIRGSF
jgi:hypothetical protein